MLSHDLKEHLSWSVWQPLEGSWLGDKLPSSPGLYRIRRVGHDDLDYIGQTGSGKMTLRQRLGMLRSVYADKMPYRDPHTAGPALWALRHSTGCEFEVSFALFDGPTPLRKGFECVAISLYRQVWHRSPTIQFGRMPAGYRMSSSNNARLIQADKRFRGGPTTQRDASHLCSIPPVGALDGDPQGGCWCRHAWSNWTSVHDALELIPLGSKGLYRIRRPGNLGLLYIGQGNIRNRLMTHLQKIGIPRYSRQAAIFAGALDCSWVINEAWHEHERLELENDLIAAYVLAMHNVPAAQFMG